MSSKPQYRVGAAGLDPRDWRLIEIVFRHSQYNKFDFVLVEPVSPEEIDILIANPMEPAGVDAVTRIRTSGRTIPVVSAVPRGAPTAARHAISIDRLTLQLLPILNRVVEMEIVAPVQAQTMRMLQEASRPAPEPVAQAQRVSNLVQFPVQSGTAPRDAASVPRSEFALKVLVVDDSPTVRKQLTMAFERMGVQVFCVADAQVALETLEDQHVDLAMVDVVMPEMDGYKLTRELKRRAKSQGKFLPVIILTSRSSPFDLARGALAGCDTYLAKPVPPLVLEAAVHKQLRRALAIDDLGAYLKPLMPTSPGQVAAGSKTAAGPDEQAPAQPAQAAPERSLSKVAASLLARARGSA